MVFGRASGRWARATTPISWCGRSLATAPTSATSAATSSGSYSATTTATGASTTALASTAATADVAVNASCWQRRRHWCRLCRAERCKIHIWELECKVRAERSLMRRAFPHIEGEILLHAQQGFAYSFSICPTQQELPLVPGAVCAQPQPITTSWDRSKRSYRRHSVAGLSADKALYAKLLPRL